MSSLNQETFVCVDCESTGLDQENDHIIEIGVIVFNLEGHIESYETLIEPPTPIPGESTEIHHITDEMVKGKPRIEEVLPKVLEMMKDHPIVGHGVGFDIGLIESSARRAQIGSNLKKNLVLDTLRLARHYGQSSVNSLEKLRQHFNIPEEGAHRAMNDVIVNIQVFKHLVSPYKTLKQVLQILEKPIALKIMPLGKHKGRPVKEIPTNYLNWAVQKDFDIDLIHTLRQELNRRKKGRSFNQASNPFQNL